MESSAVLSIPDSLEDEAGNSPELFGSNSSSESSSEASSDESEMELGHETFQSSLISSSYKKLVFAKRTPGDASADQPADGTPEDTSQAIRGYRFVSMTQLADLCATFLCPECSCDALTLEEKCEHRMGLSSWLEVVCRVCSHRVSFTTSQQIGSIMDVNRRSVLAAREIGCGRARLATFCCMMDMPPPVAAVSYGKHVKQKQDYDRRHRARELPDLPDDTEVFVTTDGQPTTGRIVQAANAPRSYIVDTPSGSIRRNRSQLNPMPATSTANATPTTTRTRSPIRTRSRTGTHIAPPKRLT